MSGIKPFPVFKLVGTSIEPIVSGSTLGNSNISVSATDKVLGRESAGAGAVEEISCTGAGRALIDDADAAAQRTTLGLIAGGAGDIWVEKAGDTMTGDLNLSGGILYGSVISNQFSNILSGDLLGMFTTLKFLNTLTGTPATDAANMIDVSGAAHDGTYKGTWAAAQRVNKGFGWMLNPNGIDNYIILGDSNDFSFGDGLNDTAFTIAGVIEISDAGTRVIFSKIDETTGAEVREYIIYISSAEKLTVIIWDESANVGSSRTQDAALSTGFHTFVVTYNGGGGATAANGIIIYIDGAVVASTAANDASYVAMENTVTDALIGASKGTAGTITNFIVDYFTPPIIDKGTVWTAAQVNRFHQYMKGVYNL